MPSKDQKTLACWLDMKLQINREGPRACREDSEGVLDLGYRQRGLSVRRVTTSGGASPVPHLACHWLRLQPLNSSGCFSVAVVATRHLDTHVTQTQTSFCLPHGRSDLTQASSWGGFHIDPCTTSAVQHLPGSLRREMEKKQRGASISRGGESARVRVSPGGRAIHKCCQQSRQEISWRTSISAEGRSI